MDINFSKHHNTDLDLLMKMDEMDRKKKETIL